MKPVQNAWDHWYRRILPTYWLSLFLVTHLPRLRIPGDIPQSDKLAHFAAYALLAFLLWRFAETYSRPLSASFAPRALVILAAYAALDEWLQARVGRSADPLDWAADAAGAAATLAILEWRRRTMPGSMLRMGKADRSKQTL